MIVQHTLQVSAYSSSATTASDNRQYFPITFNVNHVFSTFKICFVSLIIIVIISFLPQINTM